MTPQQQQQATARMLTIARIPAARGTLALSKGHCKRRHNLNRKMLATEGFVWKSYKSGRK
jgi:hypothetical protein